MCVYETQFLVLLCMLPVHEWRHAISLRLTSSFLSTNVALHHRLLVSLRHLPVPLSLTSARPLFVSFVSFFFQKFLPFLSFSLSFSCIARAWFHNVFHSYRWTSWETRARAVVGPFSPCFPQTQLPQRRTPRLHSPFLSRTTARLTCPYHLQAVRVRPA